MVGIVVPDVSKDHNTFILKVKHSKNVASEEVKYPFLSVSSFRDFVPVNLVADKIVYLIGLIKILI